MVYFGLAPLNSKMFQENIKREKGTRKFLICSDVAVKS